VTQMISIFRSMPESMDRRGFRAVHRFFQVSFAESP